MEAELKSEAKFDVLNYSIEFVNLWFSGMLFLQTTALLVLSLFLFG